MKLHLLLWLFLCVVFVTHCEEDSGEDDYDDSQDGAPVDYGQQDFPTDEEQGDPMEPLTADEMAGLHKLMDANKNGQVSMAEVRDYAHNMRKSMAQMELDDIMKSKDTNKDGKLNFDEYLGDPGKVPEEEQNEKSGEFKELDKNGDKFIDADELAQVYHHHINEDVEVKLTKVAMKDKDGNKDGKLSMDEFFNHLQIEGEPKAEIPQSEQDMFKELDVDNDGFLSLKELQAYESGSWQAEVAVKKLFEHADKDHDNMLTADELVAATHDIAAETDAIAHMYLVTWKDAHKEKNEL